MGAIGRLGFRVAVVNLASFPPRCCCDGHVRSVLLLSRSVPDTYACLTVLRRHPVKGGTPQVFKDPSGFVASSYVRAAGVPVLQNTRCCTRVYSTLNPEYHECRLQKKWIFGIPLAQPTRNIWIFSNICIINRVNQYSRVPDDRAREGGVYS